MLTRCGDRPTGSVGADDRLLDPVGLAAAAAVVDWVAVARDDRRLEYAAKPAVLAALTAAAAVLPAGHTDLVDRRWWFVAALACCLVGDVLLMLPRDLFVPGLVGLPGRPRAVHRRVAAAAVTPGRPALRLLGHRAGRGRGGGVAAAAVPATLIFRSLVRDGHRG